MNVTTNNDLRYAIALAALENVIDPWIGLNVIDLGLVYRIEFDEPASRITVTMTLSTPYCPVGETITVAVQRVILDTFTGYAATIEQTFQPPLNYDRIT